MSFDRHAAGVCQTCEVHPAEAIDSFFVLDTTRSIR